MYFAKSILLLMIPFLFSTVLANEYFSFQKKNKEEKRYVIFDMDSFIESGKPFAPKSLKLFQNLSRDKNAVLVYKAEDPFTLSKLNSDYPKIAKFANSINQIEGKTQKLCNRHLKHFAYFKYGDFYNPDDGACNYSRRPVDLSRNKSINRLATRLHHYLVYSAPKGDSFENEGDSSKEYPGDMLIDSNIPLGLALKLSSDKLHCHLHDGHSDEDLGIIPMALCGKYFHKLDPAYIMVKNRARVYDCLKISESKAKGKVDMIYCKQEFHAIKYDINQACIRAKECQASGILNNINSLEPTIQVLTKLINKTESIDYKSVDWQSRKKELLKSLDQIHQRLDNCFLTVFDAKVASVSNPPTKLQLNYKKAIDNLFYTFSKEQGSVMNLSPSIDNLVDYLLKMFNQCGEDFFKVELLNPEALDYCADKAKVKTLQQIVNGLKDDAKLLNYECHNLSIDDTFAMANYKACIGSLISFKKFKKVKSLAQKLRVDVDKNLFEDFNKCVEAKKGPGNCSTLVLGKKSLLSAPEVTKAFGDKSPNREFVYHKNYKDSFEKCLSKAGRGDKINEKKFNSCINSYKRKLVSDNSFSTDSNLSKKAIFSIASDLSKYTKKLSRDVNAFHWTDSFSASFMPQRYASSMTKLFSKNIDDIDNLLGSGLYAATDPSVSMEYGTKMIRLNLKKGGNFLDLREAACVGKNAFRVSKESRKLMEKVGCPPHPESESTCFSKNAFTRSKSSKCHDLLIGALKELDISFIAYEYPSKLPSFCNNNPEVAFVMVRPPEVQNIYKRSNKKIKKNDPNFKMFNDMADISDDFLFHFSEYLQDYKKEDDETLCEKWGSRLFGCNCNRNKSFSEDQTRQLTD